MIKRLPSEWEQITGIKVIDPDGWRVDGQAWNTPITIDDFMTRIQISTIRRVGTGGLAV